MYTVYTASTIWRAEYSTINQHHSIVRVSDFYHLRIDRPNAIETAREPRDLRHAADLLYR